MHVANLTTISTTEGGAVNGKTNGTNGHSNGWYDRETEERMARLKELLSKMQVVSQEESENADYVVCVRDVGPAYFDDDVHARCARCKSPIRHRPHVPKKPPKICLECATELSEEERRKKEAGEDT